MLRQRHTWIVCYSSKGPHEIYGRLRCEVWQSLQCLSRCSLHGEAENSKSWLDTQYLGNKAVRDLDIHKITLEIHV